jgi:phosphatidylinositol glycan class S
MKSNSVRATFFFHQHWNSSAFFEEKNLDLTDTTTQPTLNIVLFVPKKSQSPLHIHVDKKTRAPMDAFVVPQWGGIVIYNPKNATTRQVHLEGKELELIMQLFVTQLRDLLGIQPIELSSIVPSPSGVAQWEVDALIRRNLFSNLNDTVSDLHSLSLLVQNLQNMVVKDKIAILCNTALEHLEKVGKSVVVVFFFFFFGC